jgi:hypothetical protein
MVASRLTASLVFVFSGCLFISSTTASTDETLHRAARPNEIGSVMIVMYHDFGPREAKWTRTPENFKRDLETLYQKGYRPVSLSDFVNNEISTPAGLTPFVLTFDDGTLKQFEITTQSGEHHINPKSAVGVLLAFTESHPDFPLEATFFLNGRFPFKQPELAQYKLSYLVERGMDIGNHTTGHQNLALKKYQHPEIIQRSIGHQAQHLESFLADSSYVVNTYALCFGQRPRREALRRLLQKGVCDGKSYENIAVLNVGSGPALSPSDTSFDPMNLPRIRASQMKTDGLGLYDWLKYFDKHPEKKFVSDGDINTITVAKRDANRLNRERLTGKSIIILDE